MYLFFRLLAGLHDPGRVAAMARGGVSPLELPGGRARAALRLVLVGLLATSWPPVVWSQVPDEDPPETVSLPADTLRPDSLVIELGPEPAEAGGRSQAAPVSLLRFNPEGIRLEFTRRERFTRLFMGIKEGAGLRTELMALRILLDDPGVGIGCPRLRKALAQNGACDGEGRAREVARLKEWIEEEAAKPGFSERHLWYRGEGGQIDPDFLIYTSPHPWVARCYGEVVFEIREATPRGVDLNALNREVYGFYDRLSLAEKLNPRLIVIRQLLDRDEYVIPSHLPGSDLVAADIRARVPLLAAGMVRISGRLMRRYRRGASSGSRWVDLVDRRDRPIARFSLDRSVPPPPGPRSSQEIPGEVLEALRGITIRGFPVRVVR
ncbi:MAG: hypothetical protein HY815_07765 [Candidatus Riflebacteria bacterium]|nr:hypothetical protein [Candidatus Riflebacteria bacterium]